MSSSTTSNVSWPTFDWISLRQAQAATEAHPHRVAGGPRATDADGILGSASRDQRAYRHIGAMPQAGIRAHSGTVQPVGPVDLARFDSIVKVRTEGSGKTARRPGRRVPVRS